jgi:16S rRNA (uracil1498-N3)-methyltransferase
MFRFFCPALTPVCRDVEITDPREIHHLLHVARLREGNPVILFNNPDLEAAARVRSVAAARVCLRVEKVEIRPAGLTRVILACAVPKKSKFEIIIEKAVELGVSEIIPLKTARTVVELSGARGEQKLKRYHAVALNAVKQSKQTALPVIHPMTGFREALRGVPDNCQIIIPSLEAGTVPILSALRRVDRRKPVMILVGPEGDFTPNEYRDARGAGAVSVSLGPTVLKVETAALAALAAVVLSMDSISD